MDIQENDIIFNGTPSLFKKLPFSMITYILNYIIRIMYNAHLKK